MERTRNAFHRWTWRVSNPHVHILCSYCNFPDDCDNFPLKFHNYQLLHLLPSLMNIITIIPLTTVNSWLLFNASKVLNVVDTSPTGIESGCDCGQVQSQPHSQLCHGSNGTGLAGAGGEFLNAKQPLLPKQMLAASPLIFQNLSQHLQHKPPADGHPRHDTGARRCIITCVEYRKWL